MTPSGTASNGHRRPLGFHSKLAILTGALVLACLPIGAVAFHLHGDAGIIAAAVACLTCLVAGLNGLGIAALLKNQSSAVPVLAGMLVRMALPLILVLALAITSHPLLDSGFGYYLIAFYQVMLFVELLLIKASPPTSGGSRHQVTRNA